MFRLFGEIEALSTQNYETEMERDGRYKSCCEGVVSFRPSIRLTAPRLVFSWYFAVELRTCVRTYVSRGERRYLDTGEEIPDVPRSCLRVLTLTVGMKVEARFNGGSDFYPGSICGVNER